MKPTLPVLLRKLPHGLTVLITLLAAAALPAQTTPFTITFESPTYSDGMANTAFPSIWSTVDSGFTITTSGALSGAQSMLLPDNISTTHAELYINAPDDAETLDIAFSMKPTYDGSSFYYGEGGGIVLYNETNGNPASGTDDHAFGFTFRVENQNTDRVGTSFDGVTQSPTMTAWSAGSVYDFSLSLDFNSATLNYTVATSSSTVYSGSGSFTEHSGNEFVLHFYGATLGASGTLVDSISVSTSAVPEPSTYAAIFGLMSLGLVAWKKRRRGAG